jgi:hypothetical protein
MKYAPMKKTIYTLGALRDLLCAPNRRYLEFISALDHPADGMRQLRKLTRTVHQDARSYRGFNFFDENDEQLRQAIARGEFNISGFQNKRLRQCLPRFNSAQISRLLKRFHRFLSTGLGCRRDQLAAFILRMCVWVPEALPSASKRPPRSD